MTLYDVLGVTPTASPDELHRAYRARARAIHPDLQAGATEDEREATDQRMRELNDAWHVLSDPERRRAYDRTLVAPSSPRPPVVEWRAPDEQVPIGSPGVVLLARAVPLIVILAVLAGIFLFTAFAVHEPRGRSADSTEAVVGDCIVVRGGHVSEIVACGAPNDGEVLRVIGRDEACLAGEHRVDAANGSQALCTTSPR